MREGGYVCEGRPLRLGKRIGKGGEGEVFASASDPGVAIKLYSAPDAERERKIAAMVSARLSETSRLVSFPIAPVHRKSGTFAGFTMRLVHGHRALHELYAPGARKAAFPEADYRFLIRSAANISIAVSQVHKAGAVIGDINHSGFLISDRAMAAIIDADSFQFGPEHHCRVGVPEYTPPELQGRRLGDVERTAQHDAFGLAIVVFQLLFMGRHPFAGRFPGKDVPIGEAIRSRRFVYSHRSAKGAKPPPGAAGLDQFPEDLGSMFEASFAGLAGARPDAGAWARSLGALERSLSVCGDNALHYFPTASGSCLWCRMERSSGVSLFETPTATVRPRPDPGADGFDVEAAWNAIGAVAIPDPASLVPTLPVLDLVPSEVARQVAAAKSTRRVTGYGLMIAAAALLGWEPSLWLIALPLVWWGWTRAFGDDADTAAIERNFAAAKDGYDRALLDWRKAIGVDEVLARRTELGNAYSRYIRLPAETAGKLKRLSDDRDAIQLRHHLEGYRIRQANIRGIGPGRMAALASFGIETAADITQNAVLAVPGFGPSSTHSLVQWRQRVATRFRSTTKATPREIQQHDQIVRSSEAEAARLRSMLAGGADELRAAAASVRSRVGRMSPALSKAASDREQAVVDMVAAGLARPQPPVSIPSNPVPASPSNKVRAPTRVRSASPSLSSCPKCGGAMKRRLAKRGANAGRYFMGCVRYPNCRGSRSI